MRVIIVLSVFEIAQERHSGRAKKQVRNLVGWQSDCY